MQATLPETPTEPTSEARERWLVRMLTCVDEELAQDEWLRESPMVNCELVDFEEYLMESAKGTINGS
jgi:hypothetical protein